MFKCAANPHNKLKTIARYVMTFDQLREQGFTELKDDFTVGIKVTHTLKGEENKDVQKISYLAINQVKKRLIMIVELDTVIDITIGDITKTYLTTLLGLKPTEAIEVKEDEYSTIMSTFACLRDAYVDGWVPEKRVDELLEVDCETEGEQDKVAPELKPTKEYERVLETPIVLEVDYSLQYPHNLDPLLHYWFFKKQVLEGKLEEKRFGRGDKFYFKVLEVPEVGKVKIETNYSSDNYDITSIDINIAETGVANEAYVFIDQNRPIQMYHNTKWKPSPEEAAEYEARAKERAQRQLEEEELLKANVIEVQEFLKTAPTLSTVEMKAVFIADGSIIKGGKQEAVSKVMEDGVINGYWDFDGVGVAIRHKNLDSIKPDFQVIKDLGGDNYSIRILNNTDAILDDNYLCFCYEVSNKEIIKVYGATIALRKPFDDMFKKADEQADLLKQLKEGTYQW